MNKRTILVIDDEEESIAVLEYHLKKLDCDVIGITEPLRAIETIREVSPDLIILDWLMPQKEGIDVLQEIKSEEDLREIPVIISSGLRTNSTNLHEALSLGAVDFVKKPIDEIELEARVNSAIKIYDYFKESRRLTKEIYSKEIEITEAKAQYFQNELNKKNREMLVSAVSILQNKKLITVIKTNILEELKDLSVEHQLKITKVIDRYDNISNSINWNIFEKRFTELNNDFYNNLKKDFPDLSNGEQRLCAFFKLGLSTKEIAIINYSSYDAIRKAVYRIRKKINKEEAVDLNLFFQEY